MRTNMKTAAIGVDPQNGFCPSGELPVTNGDAVMRPLGDAFRILRELDPHALVIVSRDMHPEKTRHFETWPPHCIAGTRSAEIHEALYMPSDVIEVHKGQDPEDDGGYSAFEGTTPDGHTLEQILRADGVRRLVVGGLATDYCVKATVLDACGLGFDVLVVRESIAGVDVNPGDSERAIQAMRAAGARFVALRDLASEIA